MLALTTHPLHN